MNDYEIRILKADGKPTLISAEVHLTDNSAIRSARRMANGSPAEVWRGTDCIWRSSELAAKMIWKTAAQRRQQTELPPTAE
jgi:hypothetical protein